MHIHTLLDGVTAIGASDPIKVADILRVHQSDIDHIPIHIYGTFTATVKIEGTLSTDEEIENGTAQFTQITGMAFTSPALTSINEAFSHIRANVTAYTSGSIFVKAGL